MPRNPNGSFTLVAGNPVVTGTVITSDWANNTLPDIGGALSDSLSRTGNGGMLAPLKKTDGTKSAPAGTFSNDLNTGVYLEESGEMRLTAAGIDRMRWTNNSVDIWDTPSGEWGEVFSAKDSGLTSQDIIDSANESVQGNVGKALEAEDAVDLNAIAITGFKYITNAVNAPAGWATVLVTTLTSDASGGRVVQNVSNPSVTDSVFFVRERVDGTWLDWRELWHDAGSAIPATYAAAAVEGALAGNIGLSSALALIDLDTQTKAGFFAVTGGATGNPTSSIGTVVHEIGASTNEATQTFTSSSNDVRFFRRRSGGAWQAWLELWHDDGTGITAAQAAAAINLAVSAGSLVDPIYDNTSDLDILVNNLCQRFIVEDNPNTPMAGVLYLESYGGVGTSGRSQVALSTTSERTFYRKYNGSVWGPWVEMWNDNATGLSSVQVATVVADADEGNIGKAAPPRLNTSAGFLVRSGFYALQAISTDIPLIEAGTVTVETYDDDNGTQTYTSSNTERRYFRTQYQNNYRPWREMWHDANTGITAAEAAAAIESIQSFDQIAALASPSADFFALAEKRIRDNAGSGFAEWGKYLDIAPAVYEPVNEGIWAVVTSVNTMRMGRQASDGSGVSRSGPSLVNINGVAQKISELNSTGEQAAISFPPAPDGTKTYDSATGAVVTHASTAEAFEGLITNGDFRNGTTGWTAPSSTLSIDAGRLKVVPTVNNGDVYQIDSTVIGVVYRVKFDLTDGTGVIQGFIVDGSGTGGTPILSSLVSGEYEFTALSTTTTLRFVVFGGIGVTGFMDNVELMPVTESVIISRQDYTFLESWHEKISDKDIVLPLGNVQYKTVAYKGIVTNSMAELGVVQGYSAFGEWDTLTEGRGSLWSGLSDADKKIYIDDPENNIYFEDGELIQVRYRIRVIEGYGDDWASVDPQGSASLNYMSYVAGGSAFQIVVPRGELTANIDFGAGASAFRVSASTTATDGDKGAGMFTASGYNGLCFAIPIAIVQRRNSGIYEPAWNPNGCNAMTRDVSSSQKRSWWTSDTNEQPITATSQCFGSPRSGTINSGNIQYGPDAGDGATVSPIRSDSKLYDAIYASDVEDLRMSSKLLPLEEIREKYKRMAIAGEVRGFEAVPFLIGFDTQTTGSANSNLIGLADTSAMSAGDLLWVQTTDTGIGYEWVYITIVNNATTITINRSVNRFGGGVIAHHKPQLHSQANPTWTDIIGDPANISATFPNGVEGQWQPLIPDGTTSTEFRDYTLHRKTPESPIAYEFTSNNGATWTGGGGGITINGTLNAPTSSLILNGGVVHLWHYETQAHFTEDDVNSEVLDLGSVYGCSRHQEKLPSTLIGKVPTSNVAPFRAISMPLLQYGVDEGAVGFLSSAFSPPIHNVLNVAGEGPAVKALDYLSQSNNVAKLVYAYKEMVFDSSADVAADFPLTDGNSTQAFTQGEVARIDVGHTHLNMRLVVTSRSVNFSAYQTYPNGDVYDSIGEKFWETWSGTGWGDNNQFEITDNQGIETDDNGNDVLYGTASFKTQFFVIDE